MPPHVGIALTISAILAPKQDVCERKSGREGEAYVPSVRHIQDPRSQHHVTDAGPPSSNGVLKVVATLELRPIMLKAKLICARDLSRSSHRT